jgi:hypothetical protein
MSLTDTIFSSQKMVAERRRCALFSGPCKRGSMSTSRRGRVLACRAAANRRLHCASRAAHAKLSTTPDQNETTGIYVGRRQSRLSSSVVSTSMRDTPNALGRRGWTLQLTSAASREYEHRALQDTCHTPLYAPYASSKRRYQPCCLGSLFSNIARQYFVEPAGDPQGLRSTPGTGYLPAVGNAGLSNHSLCFAHVGRNKIFLDLPVHTSCTRRLLSS